MKLNERTPVKLVNEKLPSRMESMSRSSCSRNTRGGKVYDVMKGVRVNLSIDMRSLKY